VGEGIEETAAKGVIVVVEALLEGQGLLV
jgi:hypothetical protein